MTSYKGVHRAVIKARGRAAEHPCFKCGGEATEWAYLHNGEDERRSPDGAKYAVDWGDSYAPMCRPCHRKWDRENDPEYAAAMHRNAVVNGKKNGAKNLELLARLRTTEHQQAAGRRGGAVGGLKSGRIMASRRRRCLGCGMEVSPATIGAHQKASGNTGWETPEDS